MCHNILPNADDLKSSFTDRLAENFQYRIIRYLTTPQCVVCYMIFIWQFNYTTAQHRCTHYHNTKSFVCHQLIVTAVTFINVYETWSCNNEWYAAAVFKVKKTSNSRNSRNHITDKATMPTKTEHYSQKNTGKNVKFQYLLDTNGFTLKWSFWTSNLHVAQCIHHESPK